MISVEPKDLKTTEVQAYLLGGVAPRPIALVSTLSADGIPNLAPFSFFNAFGANPPTVAFSASRRIRDNTVKDTYTNLMASKECVIQAVSYDMVQQVSLASMEFSADVDEFVKSGLTPIPADIVKPARVKESPFQMECRLTQMVSLGGKAGSGNLAICEVVKFHVSEDILVDGVIHPDRINLVARMSADFYTRSSGLSVFTIDKPGQAQGIGYDQLPDFIKHSTVLSGNNLAQLATAERIPNAEEVDKFCSDYPKLKHCPMAYYESEAHGDYQTMYRMALSADDDCSSSTLPLIIKAAVCALDYIDIDFAWKSLLVSQRMVMQDA